MTQTVLDLLSDCAINASRVCAVIRRETAVKHSSLVLKFVLDRVVIDIVQCHCLINKSVGMQVCVQMAVSPYLVPRGDEQKAAVFGCKLNFGDAIGRRVCNLKLISTGVHYSESLKPRMESAF